MKSLQNKWKNYCKYFRRGEPYLIVKQSNNTEEIEGYTVDLIDEISKLLNFTYKFYLVRDNNHGSYNPETKEWNGLMREIIDRVSTFVFEQLLISCFLRFIKRSRSIACIRIQLSLFKQRL